MSKDLLVDWLHRPKLSQTDKLLITLGTFEGPAAVKALLDRAEQAGFKRTKWSNPSASLKRAVGLAIHTSAGWEITKSGREKLAAMGVEQDTYGFVEVATDLRAYLAEVSDNNLQTFVEEAVRCFEHRLKRSAVVMSWLAAAYVLQSWVFSKHLSEFNAELKRVGAKPTRIKNMEDFDLLREADFLDRISAISLIGKTKKAALKRCLDFRNNCGHPNSLKVSDRAVAAHLEVLLENVFLDSEIAAN